MAGFYQIMLQQFRGDEGTTQQGRNLRRDEIQSLSPEEQAKHKDSAFGSSKKTGSTVIFDVSPIIGESRSVDYVDQPLPGPVGIVIYKMTGNRRFSIDAKFVSRTVVEATVNYHYVNILRSWILLILLRFKDTERA